MQSGSQTSIRKNCLRSVKINRRISYSAIYKGNYLKQSLKYNTKEIVKLLTSGLHSAASVWLTRQKHVII